MANILFCNMQLKFYLLLPLHSILCDLVPLLFARYKSPKAIFLKITTMSSAYYNEENFLQFLQLFSKQDKYT